MYKNRSRGFTLIELLVVIAIIGILSAVVLASLNTARNKGTDAATQSDLTTSQTQAEIYYGGTGLNSYGTLAFTTDAGCTGAVAGSMFNDPTIQKALTGAFNATLSLGATRVACYASGTAYAIAAKTVAATGYWCVDSTGTSKQEVGAFPVAAAACP